MTYPMNSIKTYWIAYTVFLLAGITVFSLTPLSDLPAAPGNDKVHHLVAYGALVFPAALRKPSSLKLLILFFIAYSGAIELVQPYVNRYGEWRDLAANTIGIGCGLLIAELLLRRSALKNKQQKNTD
ncbi:MAG: VanZ family protein [Candidatus Electrothrix sp. AR4]|nr:VanZ family protein [Candidatus Electrothrix sp. AR4]